MYSPPFPFAQQEDQLMKMRIRIHELEGKNEMLKELCRGRRQRILELEEMLKLECRPHNMRKEEEYDSGEVQEVQRPSTCAGSSSEVGQVQHSHIISTGPIRVHVDNKENLLDSHKALQRPRRNVYDKKYKHEVRR
jgi:hypothetical protein